MPLISKEFIDQLLYETDILHVFQQQGLALEKKGSAYWCKSPFKEEKTPSCQVKPNTQKFYDFSTEKGGNAVSLLMEKNNFTYVQAIEELAKMSGKAVQYETTEDSEKYREKREKSEEYRKFTKALNKKLQQELHKLPKTHDAWKEIAKRGYTDEEVKEYGLGFAPGSQFIYQLFSDKGAVEIGKKLDLITDKNQDKFFNCLVYPLSDDHDDVLGFARRRLDDNEAYGKWINPAETELYKKDRFLYGLNFAKTAIIKNKRVWLVEGYNDVIAWQKFGITNTVGTSGTALTVRQIDVLKKLTSKVTICMDGDEAGRIAVLRSIPVLLKAGFQVDVCQLPDNLDPDDYSRSKEFTEDETLEKSLQPYMINGFDVLMIEKFENKELDELDRSNNLKEMVQMISGIPDIITQTHYLGIVQKKTKTSQTVLKKLMQEQEIKKQKVINDQNDMYMLPKTVAQNHNITDLLPMIEAYQMFIADNAIWMMEYNDSGPSTFKAVSNFSIEILQHMNDEKFPSKLFKIVNTKNEERIFDGRADVLVSPQEFKKLCANQGNFRYEGSQKDIDKLSAFLYDRMGVGRKVDVLGWNPEGFWCWNNAITIPGKLTEAIDDNGIFRHEGNSYYVPSANQIYRMNPNKFNQQKRIKLTPATHSMEEFLGMVKKVHREFGVLGILFSFASAHQDLIVNIAKGFPLFFLYGPPSTGKDELYGVMKKMFGIAKTDFMNLENRQSTGKAKLRSFGEFSNMLVHLSEYTNGDKDIDGMMKGLWDRGSYKRATLDSHVSTDSSSILSAAIVTGNQSPNDEAVLTRLIYGEMTKDTFTLQEKENFEKLETMTNDGLTSFMQKVIFARPLFEEKFAAKFSMYKKILSQREAFKGAIDRIITNYAILGATHEILKETNEIVFPFTSMEMLDVFDQFVINLRRRLDSANIFSKFWDVFLACLYGNETTKLHLNVHVKVEGNQMFLRFTEIFNRMQTEWYPRFGESCPSKNVLLEKLKTDPCYIGDTKSTRIGNFNTSAYIVDLNKIQIKENILSALNMQQEDMESRNGQGNLFGSPATPTDLSNERDKADEFGF